MGRKKHKKGPDDDQFGNNVCYSMNPNIYDDIKSIHNPIPFDANKDNLNTSPCLSHIIQESEPPNNYVIDESVHDRIDEPRLLQILQENLADKEKIEHLEELLANSRKDKEKLAELESMLENKCTVNPNMYDDIQHNNTKYISELEEKNAQIKRLEQELLKINNENADIKQRSLFAQNNNNSEKLIEPIHEEFSDENSENVIYNNWTTKNKDTIASWMKKISKTAFIYQIYLDQNSSKYNNIMLWALILSAVTTLISAVSSAIIAIASTYIWVAFGLNIVIFVANAAMVILNGSVKIFKWDELVNNISIYLEKINNFYGVLTSITIMPEKIRKNAVDFITTNSTQFETLMQQTPDISYDDYLEASTKFDKFVTDNNPNYKYVDKYIGMTESAIEMV